MGQRDLNHSTHGYIVPVELMLKLKILIKLLHYYTLAEICLVLPLHHLLHHRNSFFAQCFFLQFCLFDLGYIKIISIWCLV